jgi:t-SNARE complex subunit (syntaxin)
MLTEPLRVVVGFVQLFMDMAILVETQGDLIDQIEFSVMNSKAFTEKAVVTLQETAKIVTNTRKVTFFFAYSYISIYRGVYM